MPAAVAQSQVDRLATCLKRTAEQGHGVHFPIGLYKFLAKRYIRKYGYETAMDYAQCNMY